MASLKTTTHRCDHVMAKRGLLGALPPSGSPCCSCMFGPVPAAGGKVILEVCASLIFLSLGAFVGLFGLGLSPVVRSIWSP